MLVSWERDVLSLSANIPMSRKTKWPYYPKTLGECRPGLIVLVDIGLGGFTREVQVAWHWPGGNNVCCRPRYESEVTHIDLDANLYVKVVSGK